MIDPLIFSGSNLLLVYAVLSGSFLRPLLPTNTMMLGGGSMMLRHIVAFIAVVLFRMVAETSYDDFNEVLPIVVSSIFLYGVFLIASKMTANWWLPLLALLVTIYVIHTYRNTFPKEQNINLDYAEYGAIALSALLTIVGFLIFVGEKKIKYRGKFDYATLLIGTENGKNTPSRSAYWDSLKAAFLVAPGLGAQRGGGFTSYDYTSDGGGSIAPVSSFDFKSPALE